MKVDEYLERIGYRGGREPTAANLAALVRAHRLAVPYETLDLWRGRHTTLANEAIYDKIVTRRRGGYCFELNGLFAWLLRELVFNAPQQIGQQLYRVRRDAVLGAVVEIRKTDDTWTKVFSFDTSPQLPLDFAYAHWWCETHPDSTFRGKVWVFRLCEDGSSKSISLDFDPETAERIPTLAKTPVKGAQRLTPLRSEDALAAALKDEFGIIEN